jgi:hypothetical protein
MRRLKLFPTKEFLMTEFVETAMRRVCRNPKCRSKLPTPVSNAREAFCSLAPDGCRDRFYRLRCYICEEKKTGRLDARTCGRRKCKNALRRLGPIKDTSTVKIALGKPIKSGIPEGDKSAPRWTVVAGEISPNALHCTSVPDGPGCEWKEGKFERIEAANRRLLDQHFAKLAKDALIQRQHMPVNLLGGYHPNSRPLKLGPEKTLDEIRSAVAAGVPFNDLDAGQSKLPDPIIPGMGYDRYLQQKQQPRHVTQLPDDLSIPAFLRRVAA